MNKELKKLAITYNEFIVNEYDAATNLVFLNSQRVQTYGNITLDYDRDDILEECKGFLEYATFVSKNKKIDNETFDKILETISNTHQPPQKIASEETINEVIGLELKTLQGIKKDLKKHPHKAGMRIKIVNDSIDSLTEIQNQMLEDKLPNE